LIAAASPKTNHMRKFLIILSVVVLVSVLIFFYFRYNFVFGEGTKAGELNFFVRKGYVWKTYEGRLIQTGYRSKVPGSIQSNEFDFSVTDEKVAAILMANSGATLEVRYKEYLGTLPWRGMSKYVVDSVVTITRNGGAKGLQ
jgi:hypothetical protein